MENRSTIPTYIEYLEFKDGKCVHNWWRKIMRRNDLLRLRPYSLLFSNQVVGDEIRRYNAGKKVERANKKRKITNNKNDPINEFLNIKFD